MGVNIFEEMENNDVEQMIFNYDKATGLKTDLCGMCYAVCPYTQKYLNGEK